jgi:hypothetical protein
LLAAWAWLMFDSALAVHPVAAQGATDALRRETGADVVTLRLPEDGLSAGDEMQIEFRHALQFASAPARPRAGAAVELRFGVGRNVERLERTPDGEFRTVQETVPVTEFDIAHERALCLRDALASAWSGVFRQTRCRSVAP